MLPEAVVATLRRAWTTLESFGLPMAIAGGMAMGAWKRLRFTKDVDLLIAASGVSIHSILAQLSAAGFRAKRANPLIRLENAEFIQLAYEPRDALMEIQVDLILANSEFQREALRRRVALPPEELGFPAFVLACEDLIIMKLLAGRLIDVADAAALLAANREGLDMAHLTNWVRKLHLEQPFRQAWKEAFPSEQPPA